uniref:Flocculation protein FLO11-like n=1 Tax=Steinernema glaseri TaxID=37863 RepID=A0A1I8AQD7_9BILA
MAFIVPVMKKDYMLYQKKSPSSSPKSGSTKPAPRSTSNPILIPSRNSTACRATSSSVDSIIRPSRRAQRQRVSIRRISDSDNERTSGTEKHVHFGVCEEITYDELEEAFEDALPDFDSGNSSLESQDSPMETLLLSEQLGLIKATPVPISKKTPDSLESQDSPMQTLLLSEQLGLIKTTPVPISKKTPDRSRKYLSSSAPVLSTANPTKKQNVFKLVALCSPKN